VLVATVGSIGGALFLYAVARHGGRPLLLRNGRLLRLSEADLDRADDWFDRYGGWLVLFGRLVPGMRSFVLLTVLGSPVWNGALVAAGWMLGRNYDKVAGVIGPVGPAVTVALVVAAVGFVIWSWRRRPQG
jgi:membrane protein DedA with SNARE-associated domain